jgi:glycosyltransferase involved in cell wall biosynthesis
MDRINPTVTVIIPTYNRAELLTQSLDSVLQQTRPPDEVIVVDDGSTDNTAEVLERYGERVRCMRQENAGRSAARNRAMRALNTDYLWTMDDDDVALPDALEQHLNFLGKHPDIHFSYSSYYNFAGDAPPGQLSVKQLVEESDIADEDMFISAMLCFPFHMNGMLVPAECYRRVGLFKEELKRNEDYEMILRLTRHFRGAKLPGPTFCRRLYPRPAGGVGAGTFATDAEGETTYWKYDRMVFADLRQTLPLHEYLPRGTLQGNLLTDKFKTQALLQRASIMARHGLFEEALADLNAALFGRDKDGKLSAREHGILARMLNTQIWQRAEHRGFPATLGRFFRKRQAWTALEACATGLDWGIAGELRKGRYANSFNTMIQLWRLVGLRGLPYILATRLVARNRLRRSAESS